MHRDRRRMHGSEHYVSNRDRREAIIDGDIARIPLGVNAKDGYAIVDADMAWVAEYKWLLNSNGYARNHSGIYLHSLVMTSGSGQIVDHVSRDKLDNRRSNLRITTQSENMRNSSMRSDNTSGYRGIGWDKSRGKWIVSLLGKHIGRYEDIDEAILARNEFAENNGIIGELDNARG